MFGADDNPTPLIAQRRERVFLILAGLFLGSLTMLNILGITRVIDLGTSPPLMLTIGVLPYPITFLCTDFISEIYGRKRANMVVWVGLMLNVWVLFILWLGGILPPDLEKSVFDSSGKVMTNPTTGAPTGDYVFFMTRTFTFATTVASMIAYLLAQLVDVHIFHYLKAKTKGKHLWLRNNGSTLLSQLIDSVAVILISHYFSHAFDQKIADNDGDVAGTLMILIYSGYGFKFLAALLDTIPFYYGTKFLSSYLQIDTNAEYKS